MTPSLALKAASLSVLAVGFSLAASAGEWRLDPRRCPDLVEDRLDQRVTTSRADLREDLRDMRQVNCPASAWTFIPAKGETFRNGPRVYTGPSKVYAGRGGYYQFVAAPKGRASQPALIKIVVR
ncbi:hypothetical protein [Hyphomonas johnsonii]|uniref:Secreted protein n=1 Tax=Hyphomonas johnsonii MHS-2 TaxID=1280950 RepID=A0A059FST5_9PROT|nr:hypothetical protein [Hyphomonas johnsonii]KCZ93760.1 hypothetical protein HJO_00250 [Hyphomonas johnsonii MHS-2]